MRLLAELRRRNAIRMAGLYLVDQLYGESPSYRAYVAKIAGERK